VVDALQEAATGALAIGDPASAGAYVRRALAEQPPEAVRAALLSDLGLAEARNGAAEALEHLEQAATASDLHVRVTATRRLAGLMNFNAEASGTVALLERAIDTMPPDHELTATLHAELVGAAYTSLACHERLAGWIAGLPVPEGVPQTQLELFAVAARAYDQAVVEGDPQSALELAVRVASSPVISTDPVVGVQALVLVVVVLIVAERLEEAEAACAGVLADARAQGSGLGVSAASAGRAVVRARRGDLPGAEADGLAALELRPDHNGTRGRALEALGSALLAGVDLGRPVEELEALAGQAVRDPDLPTYSQLLIAEGALLMSQERHGEALERFRACDRPEPLWGRDCPALVPWRSGAALALARLGEADSAQRLAAEEAELARRAGTPRALGVALRAQALARGGADRADLLERAVESLEGARAPLELARALLDLGSARRRAGARTEARALLERAHGLAAGCGAAALVARAAEEIRSSGARLKRAPAAGVEGLTPSERRVAELAAEGRSNREIAQALFLSEKTVETHLGSTYRKLGIRSRGKLPGALREPA
jgi:DNA-binding CsgD family transcriptional regulator